MPAATCGPKSTTREQAARSASTPPPTTNRAVAEGGSMHVADLDLGILGANCVVGGGIAIAAGTALAAQLRRTDQVAVSFMDDRATDIGAFHESLNLAAIWDVPVIFVVENNGHRAAVRRKLRSRSLPRLCRSG